MCCMLAETRREWKQSPEEAGQQREGKLKREADILIERDSGEFQGFPVF